MPHSSSALTQYIPPKRHQKGAMLILMTFILSLIITGYLIHFFNQASSQAKQNAQTYAELGEAKKALLAWAVSNTVSIEDNPNNAIILGQLPYPDRNTGAGYDGFSDCPPSNVPFNDPDSYALLIGQLPVYGQSAPCVGRLVGLGLGANEYIEKRFWYAVSRNVVHQYEFLSSDPSSNPAINPSIIQSPTYPWLRVLDKNGNVISDRVAAVIIAPGSALSNQSRSNVADVSNYLDSFQSSGNLYANSDYDSADEDFIISESTEQFDVQNPNIVQPYLFNDKLVFITIDELIDAITKRAAAESKWLLNAYRDKNGAFPNASQLDMTSIQNNEYFAGTGTQGFLPLDITDNCQCADNQTCSCNFGAIESVSFYRESGSWNNSEDAGSCHSTTLASNKTCRCDGAGSCSRSFTHESTQFNCDANGNCSYQICDEVNHVCTKDVTNSFRFTFSLPQHASFYDTANNCHINDSDVRCNAAGSFNIGLNQSSWFKHNQWQQFMYYVFSPTNELQIGDMNNISAIIIATGQATTTETGFNQTRPSDLVSNYLDSLDNTDSDDIFESQLKNKTDNYNDQIFIVSP